MAVVASVAIKISLAENSPAEVCTVLPTMRSARTLSCRSEMREASACESCPTPYFGIPGEPVTNERITIWPYCASTLSGSARKTPCKNGRSTRSYVVPQPALRKAWPSDCSRFILAKMNRAKFTFSLIEPVPRCSAENGALRGSPSAIRSVPELTSITRGAGMKSISSITSSAIRAGYFELIS